MLETRHRDGHGRIAEWEPDGRRVRTPALILPDVPQCPRPSWTQVIVGQSPGAADGGGEGPVTLVSTGTWFHPSPAMSSDGADLLLVAAPQPGATGHVQVLPVGSELAVFHDAGGWSTDPSRLLAAWIEARTRATSGRLLWSPALGTPAEYALWTYLGADLFDASPLLLAAYRGEATTTEGTRSIADMEAIHGGTWDVDRLVAHNLDAAHQELVLVRHAIEKGHLRALVERRAYATPRMVEILRRFDQEHTFLESATSRHRETAVPCMTWDSLWMPEVRAFRRRFRERYAPPAGADILLLLPCSARKPYRLSQSHRKIQRVLDESGIRHRIHEVMVTSPLGLVPREMEESYPAKNYDVPVTGSWNRDEGHIIREQLASLLSKGAYRHVVAHVGPGTWDLVSDLLPEATHTASRHATDFDDLATLRQHLDGLRAQAERRDDARSAGKTRKLEDVRSVLRWQFGADAADALCTKAHAQGKAPYIKLHGPDGQRGQTTPERGLVSLTMAGARIAAAHGAPRVFIADFQPRKTSSLFAVGVEAADPDVRSGDEVVVVHGDDVRACGVAQMGAEEMTSMRRGVAVALRHAGGA